MHSQEEEDEQAHYQNTNQFKRDQFEQGSNNLNSRNSETALNSAQTTTATSSSAFIDTTTTANDDEEARGKRSLFPFDLPQEFPLTRTVSTSTDLNNNSDSELNYCGIFMKHVNKTSTNRVSSNTSSTTTTTMTKGILKGGASKGNVASTTTTTTKRKPLLRRSKEDLFNEFCKKTGRLIKPKNIYYIDSREGEDEEEEQEHLRGETGSEKLQVATKERIVLVNPRELNNFRNSPQQNFHQMRRSKSFQAADDFQEPLYYSQFDRQHPLLQQSSPRNMMMYQSQTLPRNFMKGGISSQSQLHIPHNNISRQFVTSNGFVNRSFDNFLSVPGAQSAEQHTYHPHNPQQHPRHHPNWPKCIPSSPSAFSGRMFYQAAGGGRCGAGGPYNSLSRESVLKAATGNEFGSFDLDRIEKDCRISHASLFQGHNGYTSDYSKSTAV